MGEFMDDKDLAKQIDLIRKQLRAQLASEASRHVEKGFVSFTRRHLVLDLKGLVKSAGGRASLKQAVDVARKMGKKVAA